MEFFILLIVVFIVFYSFRIARNVDFIKNNLHTYYYLVYSKSFVEYVQSELRNWNTVYQKRHKLIDMLLKNHEKKNKEFTPNQQYRRTLFEKLLAQYYVETITSDYHFLLEANLRALHGENIDMVRKNIEKKIKLFDSIYPIYSLGGQNEISDKASKTYLEWEKNYPGEKLKDFSWFIHEIYN